MIELKVRLSYIGRISKFILDEELIWSVWVNKKNDITSVTDFDELYEQLLGDLDMEELERDLPNILVVDVFSREKILNFLATFREVDGKINTNKELRDPSILLKSGIWKKFQVTCAVVLELPLIQKAMND